MTKRRPRRKPTSVSPSWRARLHRETRRRGHRRQQGNSGGDCFLYDFDDLDITARELGCPVTSTPLWGELERVDLRVEIMLQLYVCGGNHVSRGPVHPRIDRA